MSSPPEEVEPTAASADPVPGSDGDEVGAPRVAALEAEKRDLHDRLLRIAAEFENWKKRAKREQDEAGTRGREALLRDLLPALDNLERALKAAPEKDPVAVGVRLVDKQITAALEKFDVKRFSAMGQPFDPNLHEAIQQVESADVPPGHVAAEFAQGYTIGGRLLRAAMVGVAKAPAGAEQTSGGDGGA